jgi:ketopantoate reductase
MKTLIVGAGAMGGIIGARLLATGASAKLDATDNAKRYHALSH